VDQSPFEQQQVAAETTIYQGTMAEVILLVALGSFGSLSGVYCAASPGAFGKPLD